MRKTKHIILIISIIISHVALGQNMELINAVKNYKGLDYTKTHKRPASYMGKEVSLSRIEFNFKKAPIKDVNQIVY